MGNRRYSILVLFLVFLVIFLESIESATEKSTEICSPNAIQAHNVTLKLALSYLALYEGNCTCELYRITFEGNITMDPKLTHQSCDSVTLDVEGWGYRGKCSENPSIQTNVYKLGLGTGVKIFMARLPGDQSPIIAGSISFLSLDDDELTLVCKNASFDIPPTTASTTTTTTEAPSPIPTIAGIAAGVIIGFLILLIIICLCIRHREKRRKEHDAKLANKRGEIPEEDRETNDPVMTRLSWYKSIPIRLKRLYAGEGKKKKPSRVRRGAKGLSQNRRENGDAGRETTTKRAFARLFRSKSSSLSSRVNSTANSTIEDDVRSSAANSESNIENYPDAFEEVAPQHGGGIFMDVRRTSCEALEKAVKDNNGFDAVNRGQTPSKNGNSGIGENCDGSSVRPSDDGPLGDHNVHFDANYANVQIHPHTSPDGHDKFDSKERSNTTPINDQFDDKYASVDMHSDANIDLKVNDVDVQFDDNHAGIDFNMEKHIETSSTESASVNKHGSTSSYPKEEAIGDIGIMNDDVYSRVEKHNGKAQIALPDEY